jgi:hypothetical protein
MISCTLDIAPGCGGCSAVSAMAKGGTATSGLPKVFDAPRGVEGARAPKTAQRITSTAIPRSSCAHDRFAVSAGAFKL